MHQGSLEQKDVASLEGYIEKLLGNGIPCLGTQAEFVVDVKVVIAYHSILLYEKALEGAGVADEVGGDPNHRQVRIEPVEVLVLPII